MQASSHRWVGAASLDNITPSIFDHRIPVPGLTPHRSEREEAMLAFYSSNERPPLPDSVFTALGLAAEAVVAKQERVALRRELGMRYAHTSLSLCSCPHLLRVFF